MASNAGGDFSWHAPKVDRGTDVVAVLVGPDKTKFSLHKNLICACSPFFKRAFEGDFAEAKSQQMELPEEMPDLFKFLSEWLYMPSWRTTMPINLLGTGQRKETFWISLYHMGDRLIIPGIRLLALKLFAESFDSKVDNVPDSETIAYLSTPDKHQVFRDYIVRHVAWWISSSGDWKKWTFSCKSGSWFSHDLAVELASRFRQGHRIQVPNHPCGFLDIVASTGGIDMLKLKAEARAADTETSGKSSASVGTFAAAW